MQTATSAAVVSESIIGVLTLTIYAALFALYMLPSIIAIRIARP
jgi:hypothetical protein